MPHRDYATTMPYARGTNFVKRSIGRRFLSDVVFYQISFPVVSQFCLSYVVFRRASFTVACCFRSECRFLSGVVPRGTFFSFGRRFLTGVVFCRTSFSVERCVLLNAVFCRMPASFVHVTRPTDVCLTSYIVWKMSRGILISFRCGILQTSALASIPFRRRENKWRISSSRQ